MRSSNRGVHALIPSHETQRNSAAFAALETKGVLLLERTSHLATLQALLATVQHLQGLPSHAQDMWHRRS